MTTIFRNVKLLNQGLLGNTVCSILSHGPKRYCTYEGDGKTKAKVLNNDFAMGLMINSFNVVSIKHQLPALKLQIKQKHTRAYHSQDGFRLNIDVKILGPMAIFPRTVLAWNVGTTDAITENSLRLFSALEPKLDILVIGTGDEEVTPALAKRLSDIMKPHKIILEILKTENACATFNFLNADGRLVAAALIPPKRVRFDDMGLLAAKTRRKEIYGEESTKLIIK